MLSNNIINENRDLSAFVTGRLSEIAKAVFSGFGVDFSNMEKEDIDRIAAMELNYRLEFPNSSIFVPLSVADREETIRFWLLTAFAELIDILTEDGNFIEPSLRCEYLIQQIVRRYINNIYVLIAEEKADEEVFLCEIPSCLNECIDRYAKELREMNEEEAPEDRLTENEIQRNAEAGFADIRCWVGHPDAPDYYGGELLMEDDDCFLLDKYDEGSLFYSDRLTGLGVFQWRDV